MARLFYVVLLFSLGGCGGTMYPITSGSHVPGDVSVLGGRAHYAIWSNHAGITHTITNIFINSGFGIVERTKLERIFDEQKLHLVHSSEREADLLRVGRLAGATQVIFTDVSMKPIGYWIGAPQMVSVTVRSVDVESGLVRWTGTASYPDTPSNPDQAAMSLAHWAVIRATCPTEGGYQWEDPTEWQDGGCKAGR